MKYKQIPCTLVFELLQECGNYRGIQFMSHSMKIWKKIIDKKIRSETLVTINHFGFKLE